MKVEASDGEHHISVTRVQRGAGAVFSKELLQSRRFFFEDKGRTNAVTACEQTLDGDWALTDKELVSLEFSAPWNIYEISVVLKPRVIRCVDWYRMYLVHLGIGMA
jgi:hypothetical protein